jgi:hypothetical protein
MKKFEVEKKRYLYIKIVIKIYSPLLPREYESAVIVEFSASADSSHPSRCPPLTHPYWRLTYAQ